MRAVWVGGVGGFGFSTNLRSYLMLVFGSCLWVFWLACLAIAFEMVGCFAGLLPLVVVWISGLVRLIVLFCSVIVRWYLGMDFNDCFVLVCWWLGVLLVVLSVLIGDCVVCLWFAVC